MPEGPFGQVEIRGPLSDEHCRMTVYVRGIGTPRDDDTKSEVLLELEERIRESGRIDTPASGKFIFSNAPTGMNIVEVAVGLRDEGFLPDQIQRNYTSTINKVKEISSVARISSSTIVCGEPKEILDAKASAVRF